MSLGTIELPRELDFRTHDGVHVTLSWDPTYNKVFVTVRNERDGQSFIVPVEEGQSARDVFEHPYAYRG